MQVTAFQSAQKDSSILSPRSSTSLDSPMARALAASAAGDLPLSMSHMCPWHLRALSFFAMVMQMMAGDLHIIRQALQLGGLWGQRV